MALEYDSISTPLEKAQAVSDWNNRWETHPVQPDGTQWLELMNTLLGESVRRSESNEVSPSLSQAPGDRFVSKAYQEAQAHNRHVVFVCAQGQERSVAAAKIALLRGEEQTHYLVGGFYSFGDTIKSRARNQARAELGFFHRTPNPHEVQLLNERIDELSYAALRKLMLQKLGQLVGGDPSQHAYLRIFYDEKSAQADEFMRILDSLEIPYETVTSPQMSREIKALKRLGDDYNVAGHNWLVV